MNQWPNDWIEMNNINLFLSKLILQISLIWFDKANSNKANNLQIDPILPATLYEIIPLLQTWLMQMEELFSRVLSLVLTQKSPDWPVSINQLFFSLLQINLLFKIIFAF